MKSLVRTLFRFSSFANIVSLTFLLTLTHRAAFAAEIKLTSQEQKIVEKNLKKIKNKMPKKLYKLTHNNADANVIKDVRNAIYKGETQRITEGRNCFCQNDNDDKEQNLIDLNCGHLACKDCLKMQAEWGELPLACFCRCALSFEQFKEVVKGDMDQDAYEEFLNNACQQGIAYRPTGTAYETLCFGTCEGKSKAQVIALACGHRFCEECLFGFIEAKIEEGVMICPKKDCEHMISMKELESLGLHKEVLIFYGKEMLDHFKPKLEKLHWSCSYPDCKFVHYGNTKDCCPQHKPCSKCKDYHLPSVQCLCSECGGRHLGHCLRFTEYREVHTKPCPNCRMPIEKNAGCDHMTCKCKYQFWWSTLQPYNH